MTPCPTDSALNRLLADTLPAADVGAVERHLDGCADCRRRLDRLADVTAVGSALAQAADRDPTPAPGLARAIEQLESEATARVPTASHIPPLPILPATDRPGFIGRLGGIEIRRVIGRGGMGVVYEGLDPALDRQVAVKVLSPHLVGDGEAKERFLREARAAAALTHDHVVTIHAIDQFDGGPFLVLQHVAGESLAERLAREGRLPVEAVARIGAQVARGLAAAHARGLVHRDVKPANILIEQGTGVARLTDFGLAKLVGRTSITGRGALAGTPGYMSPEQAAGREIDARSDLFSLGVVLYAAAAGRPPFGGDSPFVVLDQIRTRAPTPLARLDPTLPAWFCAVVGRLLEKDPDRRIQTAAEVADRLERRTDKPGRRSVAVFWLAGAAAVVIGLVILLPRVTKRGPDPDVPGPPPTAVPPGFVIVGRPDHFPTLGEAARAAADGDTIEVHGTGPHRERKVEVRAKRLTVRAAPGPRPLIQPDAPGQRAEAQWLNTDSELTVEGLDILWPVPGPKPFDFANLTGVLGGPGGKLTVRNCRVVCGRGSGCVRTAAPELTIDRCHFVAEEGVAVSWRCSPGGRRRVTGSVLEGGSAVWLFVPAAGGPEPEHVELEDNTVAARGVFWFAYREVPKQTVRISARRNVLSADHLFGLPTRAPTAAGAPEDLRAVVAGWNEADNVYDKKCTFLVAIRVFNPPGVFPTRLTELTDWLDFWQAKDTGSVEGEVRFHPRAKGELPEPLRFDRVESPTGQVPARVGAGELPVK